MSVFYPNCGPRVNLYNGVFYVLNDEGFPLVLTD